MPKVSVLIPTYNAGEFICQAIDSVLAQTYTDFEIIVVDDGSTDDTRERLAAYGSTIRYVHQENRERSAARNHGIRLAGGEFIAFLDADDRWLPQKLAKQLVLLERQQELDLVYSWAQAFYGDRQWPRILGTDFEKLEGLEAFEGLLLGKSIPTLTVVARKKCLQDVRLFDEAIVIGEDWDLWLRIALQFRIGFVPEVLADYRLTGTFQPAQMARHRVQETRLHTVRKVVALAQEQNLCLPAGLADRALARAWWLGSLIDYALRDVSRGQLRCTRAIEHDIEFFRTADAWIESLIAFAIHLYDTETPQQEAEEFISSVLDHLPEAAKPLQRSRRQAMGRLKAGYAFQALKQRDFVLARQLMRRAAMYYPPLLRNLGVVSICLRDTWADRLKSRFKAMRIAP